MADKTRLVIVDDEPLFRELLCNTLSTRQDLEVVGTAADGESAVLLARREKPDVVLMDIEMPGKMDGIEAALQIKKERPQTGVVILSAHSERRYVTSLPLENMQGWGYLLKQTAPDLAAVVRAIQGSKAGMVVLDPSVVSGLHPRQGSPVARLNPRHQEVLELMAQGYSNAAIARLLRLSRKSVETYINVIYQELQLSHEEDIHARVKATLMYLESSSARRG
ncbi:MAG: response regulator transcription factor [Dehalococcoidia bacterium]|nr:response regulator transcription factor [Dehalococcoidia bacterium]